MGEEQERETSNAQDSLLSGAHGQGEKRVESIRWSEVGASDAVMNNKIAPRGWLGAKVPEVLGEVNPRRELRRKIVIGCGCFQECEAVSKQADKKTS